MSSSNLLKGFGLGADVIGQLATDKAMRRKSTGVIRGFDITDGELIEDVLVTVAMDIPHTLNRVPAGVIVMKSSPASQVSCTATTSSTVQVVATPPATVTIWVA